MYLYGASGHAKVIIDILEKSGIPIDGLFDDNIEITKLHEYNCTKYSFDEHSNDLLIISVGDNRTRQKIVNSIGHTNYGKAIDINSLVSQRVKIEEGSVVMPGAVINSSTVIRKHVIINSNSTVEHDCIIEDYVHISPGCSLAGGVKVSEGTHIGTGASVIPSVVIGKWCVIGAGSVIICDIPDYSVVVGIPGKIIKKNIEL